MVELIIFLLFIAGVIMKLFHLPFHTLVMVASLTGLLFLNLSRLFRNKPGVRRTAGWLGLATISWLIFFLFEVKFFGGTLLIIAAALFVSVVSLLMTLFEPGALPGGRIMLLLVALFFASATSWMTPHQRFYTYNIRFNKAAMTDYTTLDKYSWFLYLGQQYDEATRISKLALNIASQKGDEASVAAIKEHSFAIRDRNWMNYNNEE